jgi:hypothetical protein
MTIEVSNNYAYNAAIMMRPMYSGTIIIVEGDHDKQIFQNFFNKEKCQIIVARKKSCALNAISRLNHKGYTGIIAIVDADFQYLDNEDTEEPNVVITDSHDLYTMIFSSNGLDKIVTYYCDPEQVAKVCTSIKDFLLKKASIIGIFRWLSSTNRKNYRLTFRDLNINDCINKNSLEIIINNLITNVLHESKRTDLNPEMIKREILEIDPNNYDLLDLCQGHDVLKILFIGLKNKFGSKMGKRIDFAQFEIAFRISYERGVFSETRMYQSLQAWETENSKYCFLN